MPTKPDKTVFWFDDGKRPNVADSLEKERDITLHRLAFNGPKADNWGAMSASHAYCITSTRQELPEEYRCNAALIVRCPDLLAVSTSGAGYDTVDVAATDRSVRAGKRAPRESFKGWNARGRTVGVVGIGNIGSRVARICGLGLQMKVLACDPYLTAEQVQARGATKVELATLLAESRFVSIHCPYNDETRNMIGARELNAMQAGSYLITTARGGIVDEGALAAALKAGHIAGAGVDVWIEEPPPLSHPLLAFDNLIATYHTAGITHDSRNNMADWNAQQLAGILRGERPPRLINPDAWERFAQRFERIFGSRPD